MNDPIEELLRETLQRVEPPPGLRERVLHALPAPHQNNPNWLSSWTISVAAAALVAISAGASWIHLQEQTQARQTRQQALYALQLAGNKLAVIDLRLRRSSPEFTVKERSK